jgi:hypothetical protein
MCCRFAKVTRRKPCTKRRSRATAWKDHTSCLWLRRWLFATSDPRRRAWLVWVLLMKLEDNFVLGVQVIGGLSGRGMVFPFDKVVQVRFVMV